jgi:hypothetical protein
MKRAYRSHRGLARGWRPEPRGHMRPTPCHICGAADARDADHCAGCPSAPPLPKAELIARARAIEAAWAEKHGAARGAAA